MSWNPLSRLEKHIKIPQDLAAVTTIAEGEQSPDLLGLSAADRDAIWAAVENLFRTGIYPAVSFCLRRHGQILLNRTLGHSHGAGPDESGPAVLAKPETPFCLFSASKAITAMLVHLLEEEGKINLLNPVAYYIPEFGRNGKKQITIQQILAHRAGIATLQRPFDPEILFEPERMLHVLYEARPTSLHGREQAYHALTGGYVLGQLIERITGAPLRQYMRTRIQEPLGFKWFNYGVEPGQYDAIATNYVTGLPLLFPVNRVMERLLGAPLETAIALSNDPRFYQVDIPAGNIVATAQECTRFFQCLLNGGELDGVRIFQPVTIDRAVREVSQIQVDRVLLLPMRYSAGMMLGNSGWGTFGPATPSAYGHLGLTNNFVWADPERAISVALLTSGNPLLGTHLPRLGMLLNQISRRCRKLF